MIRDARKEDVPQLLELISELAEGEAVTATEDGLRRDLFPEPPIMHAFVAEREGHLIGYLLYNLSYQSRVGSYGVYMADLLVTADARRTGTAAALMSALAQRCVENNWHRIEWKTYKTSMAALAFYAAVGGRVRDGVSSHILADDALIALAANSAPLGYNR